MSVTLSFSEVLALSGLSEVTVRREVRAGRLNAAGRDSQRRMTFAPEEVERWRGERDRGPGLEELLWAQVQRGGPEECWPWTGSRITGGGYGRLRRGRRDKHLLTHRLAWELTNGPIPEGLRVCHHCDNPPCCNPAHLFLGTDADNSRDMVSKDRHARGQRNHFAKLTEECVRQIRAAEGTLTAIGARFGCSPVTVRDIKHGKTWTHVR